MRASDRRIRMVSICLLSFWIGSCSLFDPDKRSKTATPSAAELLREGDARLASGEFDLAAQSLTMLLESHPQSEAAAQAAFELAAIYLSRDSPLYDPARAGELLAGMATDHPRSPLALAAGAILALLQENKDLRYEDIVPAVPAAEMLTRQGAERLVGDDPGGAAEAFERVIEEHPESREAPEAMFQLALIRLDPQSPLQDRARGEALLARLGETYPNSAWTNAAAALRALSRRNVDLRRAVAELRDQLDQLKQIDLDSDG